MTDVKHTMHFSVSETHLMVDQGVEKNADKPELQYKEANFKHESSCILFENGCSKLIEKCTVFSA